MVKDLKAMRMFRTILVWKNEGQRVIIIFPTSEILELSWIDLRFHSEPCSKNQL
jgi:hypothetical protein